MKSAITMVELGTIVANADETVDGCAPTRMLRIDLMKGIAHTMAIQGILATVVNPQKLIDTLMDVPTHQDTLLIAT